MSNFNTYISCNFGSKTSNTEYPITFKTIFFSEVIEVRRSNNKLVTFQKQKRCCSWCNVFSWTLKFRSMCLCYMQQQRSNYLGSIFDYEGTHELQRERHRCNLKGNRHVIIVLCGGILLTKYCFIMFHYDTTFTLLMLLNDFWETGKK